MILHSDDQDWTSSFIYTTITILTTSVYFTDDILFLGYEIGFILLIPLNPCRPHLGDFFFVELTGDAESGYRLDVGVEFTTVL
jgi:hypothetical protein